MLIVLMHALLLTTRLLVLVVWCSIDSMAAVSALLDSVLNSTLAR